MGIIPLTRQPYVDTTTNRLGVVKVAGLDMSSDVSAAVTNASMSFSSTQVGQFSMTVADSPDAQLITSGMFGPGTTIDWADQHLEVRSIEFRADQGTPQLVIKARSRVISALRGANQTGKTSWGQMDVTTWVLDRCNEVGAIPVVQGGLGDLTFARQQQEGTTETTWDVMAAAAKNVGCLCYEFEQIVTFMRPTALVDAGRARRWELYWNNYSDYTPGLTGMPDYSWTADSTPAESLTFQLVSADADLARPGDRVTLNGATGMATGLWMVNDVTLPLSLTEPVRVTCGRPIDPAPVAQNAT